MDASDDLLETGDLMVAEADDEKCSLAVSPLSLATQSAQSTSWRRHIVLGFIVVFIAAVAMSIYHFRLSWSDAHYPGRLIESVARLAVPSINAQMVMENLITVGDLSIGLPVLTQVCLALCPLLEVLPRFRRDKSVGRYPLLPFSMMAMCGMIFTSYGFVAGNASVVVPNLLGLLLGLYYSYVHSCFCPQGAEWLPLTRFDHGAAAFATTVFCVGVSAFFPTDLSLMALGVLGNVVAVLMYASPLLVLRTVVRDKNTKDLPFGFACIVTLNSSVWMYYGCAMLNDVMIYASFVVALGVSGLQFLMFVRFGIHC